ncbi:hypothetical protein ACQX2U_11985, partial [Corynebacterium diphtheriae]
VWERALALVSMTTQEAQAVDTLQAPSQASGHIRKSVNDYGSEVKRRGIGNVDDNGLFSMLPKFKDGGAIRPMWELQLENGHKAVQSRNGNPYTWGYEDCSGYMSAIADAILHGGRGRRAWATGFLPRWSTMGARSGKGL